METKTYGIKQILFAPVAVDETALPADNTFVEKFRTYRDSVSFVEDAADIQEEYCDQVDEAIFESGTLGKKTIKGNAFDFSPETLLFLKGGTVVDGTWKEPTTLPEIYSAVKIITNTDVVIAYPKVRIFSNFNAEFKKKGLSLIPFELRPKSQVQISKLP